MATVVDPQVRTNWKSLDIRSLESLANSRAGSKSISKLRGQDAAAIADLLDQVPIFEYFFSLLLHVFTRN